MTLGGTATPLLRTWDVVDFLAFNIKFTKINSTFKEISFNFEQHLHNTKDAEQIKKLESVSRCHCKWKMSKIRQYILIRGKGSALYSLRDNSINWISCLINSDRGSDNPAIVSIKLKLEFLTGSLVILWTLIMKLLSVLFKANIWDWKSIWNAYLLVLKCTSLKCYFTQLYDFLILHLVMLIFANIFVKL